MHGGEVPEIRWQHGDELCGCVFQRIGDWTNPYIGRTLRVRMCCIWAELYKDYPEFVQEIPASYDWNTGLFQDEPQEWNGEEDMPESLWHRQLAVMSGMELDEVQEKFEGQLPPKGIPRPKRVEVREPMSEHEVIGRQLMAIEDLEQQLNQTIGIIHAIKNGELDMERITLSDNGVSIEPEAEVAK